MAEQLEITQIKTAEMLEAINRSEVDMQIATAKQYPRDVKASIKRIEMLGTIDEATAESCFYTLSRGSGDGKSIIEGPSVRLAEIVASSWGNLRVQSNIIGNDGKFITSRGICHDLESNFAASCEVKRRITTSKGQTFSEDMQVVTGNAAGAIAFRNAVFKVVPMALLKQTLDKIKEVAMGKGNDLEVRRQKALAYFAGLGVTDEMVFDFLSVKTADEIDSEKLFQLAGAKNAIKEGTSTAKEMFIVPYEKKHKAAAAEKAQTDAQSKVAAALQKQADGDDMPE